MTPLVISADDYGYSAPVDRGILHLIEMGRLTATSCLVMHPRWEAAAKQLTPAITAKADIGLHLDFTEFGPLRRSLPVLITLAFTRGLAKSKIHTSIAMQLDRFEQACQQAPDYIDGHQHIHQLPQIRQALIEELSRRYSNNRPWIRISSPPPADGFKGLIIHGLGADELSKTASRHGFQTSRHLLGVYDFNVQGVLYLKRLDRWLKQARELSGQSVLMCHPAEAESGYHPDSDPIYASRLQEFAALASADFDELLLQHQVALVRRPQAA